MLRLGIVGCGRVTTLFHLKAIRGVEGVTVAAVADLDRGRMMEVKSRSGAERGYTDLGGLLSDPGVDAVAINTPPRFHEEMTLESLKAGKHVLCEKPIAESVEGCVRVKEAQEATGLAVVPVHNYALTPCVDVAMGEIDRGGIEEVRRLVMRFNNNLRGYGPKTGFRLGERLSIVPDILPHTLSVAQALAGPPKVVKEAKGWMKMYDVVDSVSLSLETEGGVDVDCSMNWTSLIPSFEVDVLGESGRISMEIMKRPFRVSVESSLGRRVFDERGLGKYVDLIRLKHPSFTRQYLHFIGVVNGSEQPRFTLNDEVRMANVMEETVRLLS